MSIPDFHGSPEELLPVWARRLGSMEAETDNCDTTEVVPLGPTPTRDRSDHLMPNCVVIPGLLHIVDNALHDCNKKMPWFDVFWVQAKNMEALLTDSLRRNRYRATCLHGSEHEECGLFDSWAQTLYEKRWGDTEKFLRKLRGRSGAVGPLRVLRDTWDHTKYGFEERSSSTLGTAAVDADVEQTPRADDAEGQAIEGKAKVGRFDALLLRQTLRCPKWAAYLELVLELHEIPGRLASWAEGCPCHEGLWIGHTVGRRRALFAAEVGEEGLDCVMKGRRGPELAAGYLREAVRELADQSFGIVTQSILGSSSSTPGVPPQVLADLVGDWEAARLHLECVLLCKTDFWSRLPYKLIGCAHYDEAVARRCCQEARAEFMLSESGAVGPPAGAGGGAPTPTPTRHHRVTLALLGPGPHRGELDRFIAGTPRSDLSVETQREIARLNFAAVVERRIESRHKDVSRYVGNSRYTPAGVSLHLRMHMVRRLLSPVIQTPEALRRDWFRLCDNVAAAQRTFQLPFLLGLAEHPGLPQDVHEKSRTGKFAGKISSTSALVAIEEVVYHSDLRSQFLSLEGVKRKHELLRSVEMRPPLEGVARSSASASVVDLDAIMLRELQRHFKHVASPDYIYCVGIGTEAPLDESCPELHTLSQVLAPHSSGGPELLMVQDERTCAGPGGGGGAVCGAVGGVGFGFDDDDFALVGSPLNPPHCTTAGPAHGQVVGPVARAPSTRGRLYFTAVPLTNPSLMKLAPLLPAARGRLLCKSDQVIALHRTVLIGEQLHVVAEPANLAGQASPVCVLQSLGQKYATLERSLLAFRKVPLQRRFSDPAGWVLHIPSKDLCCSAVVQGLFKLSAYGQLPRTARDILGAMPGGIDMTRRVDDVLAELQLEGLAVEPQPGMWMLTQGALQRMVFLHALDESSAGHVCHVRPNVPLEETTMYELLRILLDEGWVWRPLPRGGASLHKIATEGTLDAEGRVFYTSRDGRVVGGRAYLLCLVRRLELLSRGCAFIPHGKSCATYVALLEGKDGPAPKRARAVALGRFEADGDLDGGPGQRGGAPSKAEKGAVRVARARPLDDPEDRSGSASEEECAEVVETVPHGGGAPAPCPAGAEEAQDDVARASLRSILSRSSGRWGAFLITHKTSGRYGGFQAQCPFHRKSDVTGCKKYLACRVAGEEGQASALLCLQLWCIRALEYNFQWQHMAFHPTPADLPPNAVQVVEAGFISERPDRGDVLADADKEALSERAEAALKRKAPAWGAQPAKRQRDEGQRIGQPSCGVLDALDGVGCAPLALHARMVELHARGGIPFTTVAQRERNQGTAGSTYGAPPEFADAVRFGYLSPNLPAPSGFRWKARGGTWTLAPLGG